jgi:pimeloyl-ACP methyl ester carboxylesterase
MQQVDRMTVNVFDTIKIESRIKGLNLALIHLKTKQPASSNPVLFLHGSSFPSSLSFGFRMNNYSWMDYLSEKGYDVYALDFLGYGSSDRYPQMSMTSNIGMPLGTASEIYKDVEIAVNYICENGAGKVHIIAHSWGGLVASIYTSLFPARVQSLVLFASVTPLQHSFASIDTPAVMYEGMTPDQRVSAMESLTPKGKICQLEPEVFSKWKSAWLASDPLALKDKNREVHFPAGYASDLYELERGKFLFDPKKITVPTLLIRGAWDTYPDEKNYKQLAAALSNAPLKKYVVIPNATHVMHLEKARIILYQQVLLFLNTLNSK